MSEARVTVIVPVYNVEPYLRKCIDSILAQTHGNMQIILVNDGSTDASGEICEEYGKKDPRILVIHKKNGGLSSARNAGLDAAAGDYISFIDSDDYIDPDMVSTMLDLAEEHSADLAQCGIYFELQDGTYEVDTGDNDGTRTLRSGKETMISLLVADRFRCSVCCSMFRADLVRDIRFDERIRSEDFVFLYDVLEKAKNVAQIEKAKYHYVTRSNSYTTGKLSPENFAFLETIEKMAEDETDPALFPCWKVQLAISRINILSRVITGGEFGEYQNILEDGISSCWKQVLFPVGYRVSSRLKFKVALLKLNRRLYEKLVVRHYHGG